MATHSSILAWRIPGTGEPGGLLSLGWHRVRHDWSDLAAAAAEKVELLYIAIENVKWYSCCEKIYQLLRKLNTELPWPSNSIPTYILKIENRDSDTYMLMLIAALSQYLKGRNNPSVHHQMNKQILVYTYNGISFCLRGMTFWYMLKYEWTLKNYACQTQKHIYYMTPLNMKYLDSANS